MSTLSGVQSTDKNQKKSTQCLPARCCLQRLVFFVIGTKTTWKAELSCSAGQLPRIAVFSLMVKYGETVPPANKSPPVHKPPRTFKWFDPPFIDRDCVCGNCNDVTNRKSHTRFRLVPKSMILMTLNGRYALLQKNAFYGAQQKNSNEDRPVLSAAKNVDRWFCWYSCVSYWWSCVRGRGLPIYVATCNTCLCLQRDCLTKSSSTCAFYLRFSLR